VKALQNGGVEIHRAEKPFMADGREYGAGSYVIRTDQPASAYAKTLLEEQRYPDIPDTPGGSAKRPYDVITHHLPLFMGVRCDRIKTSFEARLELLDRIELPKGHVVGGSGSSFAFHCTSNASALAANLLLREGLPVWRSEHGWALGDQVYVPGTYIVEGEEAAVRRVAEQAHVQIRRIEPNGALHRRSLAAPRVGVYRSWLTGFAACDEGWLRFVLENYGFGFETLRNRDLQERELQAQFDVIVVPQHLPGDLMYGQDPYAFAGATPHQRNRALADGSEDDVLGDYPEEYARGIGERGMAGLLAFVKAGGSLVMLDTSSDAAIRYLHLPVTNVLEGVKDAEFYNPGSIMRLLVRPEHPLGYGFEREALSLFVNSPAFEVHGDAEVVARYPLQNQLISGWMQGDAHVAGKAALVDVPLGKGRVLLFGFRPHFRAQMRATYRFLFNALFYAALGDRVAAPPA
jgi:hypothetical protein